VTTGPAPLVEAGVASCFGTLGELVQGQVDGRDFLVTLPADVWSTAVASPSMEGGIDISPAGKRKSAEAARLLIRYLERSRGITPPPGIAISVDSAIPPGKGMASSSADIVATCRSIASLLSIPLTPEEISAIAARIEPSDGVMYGETVVYDFMRGELLERLGAFVPASALVIDPGGTVDTVSCRRVPYSGRECQAIATALRLVRDGFRNQDLGALGRAATMSAIVNQRRHHKRALPVLLRVCREVGGVGVAVAHSGTILTLLLPPDEPSILSEAEAGVGQELPGAACRRISIVDHRQSSEPMSAAC